MKQYGYNGKERDFKGIFTKRSISSLSLTEPVILKEL